MILILSYKEDNSSLKIIEWLSYLNCSYKCVYLEKEDLRELKICISDNKISILLNLQDGDQINFDHVSYFLYRGGTFCDPILEFSNDIPQEVYNLFLDLDRISLLDFIYSEINSRSIGYIARSPLNKLVQLKTAQQKGMYIPNTVITSKKADKNLNKLTPPLINKAIQENIFIQLPKKILYQRVESINLNKIRDSFFPSLFQELVDTKNHIRTFFLDGDFFSIKIKSNSLGVDMRDHYDTHDYFSFELPISVQVKLSSVFNQLHLISGSVDLLEDQHGNYIFLEINTEGQYDWVGKYGGHDLHKKIAQFLYEKEKKHFS